MSTVEGDPERQQPAFKCSCTAVRLARRRIRRCCVPVASPLSSFSTDTYAPRITPSISTRFSWLMSLHVEQGRHAQCYHMPWPLTCVNGGGHGIWWNSAGDVSWEEGLLHACVLQCCPAPPDPHIASNSRWVGWAEGPPACTDSRWGVWAGRRVPACRSDEPLQLRTSLRSSATCW